MASPDVSPYVDLKLQDYDAQDLVDMAVAETQISLPTWVPRETNQEMLIYEGMSVQVAELVYAINRLPSSVVRSMLTFLEVEYDVGQQPEVDVRFHMGTDYGTTIPEGTEMRLDLPDNKEPIIFSTLNEFTVPPGVTEVVVSVIGDRFTADANGYPDGIVLTLLNSIIYVDTVVTDGAIALGRDPETDEEYFARGTRKLSRMTAAIVTPDQFIQTMMEEPYVEKGNVLDNYDGVGTNLGTDYGHVTLVPYGNNAALTTPQKNALLAKMVPMAMSALTLHIIDPNIQTVAVTAQVHPLDGYDSATVIANVQAALDAYLDPMAWDWSTTVRRNDLISLVSHVEGVDYLISMSTPAADVALTGNAPLPNAGTLTITTA